MNFGFCPETGKGLCKTGMNWSGPQKCGNSFSLCSAVINQRIKEIAQMFLKLTLCLAARFSAAFPAAAVQCGRRTLCPAAAMLGAWLWGAQLAAMLVLRGQLRSVEVRYG